MKIKSSVPNSRITNLEISSNQVFSASNTEAQLLVSKFPYFQKVKGDVFYAAFVAILQSCAESRAKAKFLKENISTILTFRDSNKELGQDLNLVLSNPSRENIANFLAKETSYRSVADLKKLLKLNSYTDSDQDILNAIWPYQISVIDSTSQTKLDQDFEPLEDKIYILKLGNEEAEILYQDIDSKIALEMAKKSYKEAGILITSPRKVEIAGRVYDLEKNHQAYLQKDEIKKNLQKYEEKRKKIIEEFREISKDIYEESDILRGDFEKKIRTLDLLNIENKNGIFSLAAKEAIARKMLEVADFIENKGYTLSQKYVADYLEKYVEESLVGLELAISEEFSKSSQTTGSTELVDQNLINQKELQLKRASQRRKISYQKGQESITKSGSQERLSEIVGSFAESVLKKIFLFSRVCCFKIYRCYQKYFEEFEFSFYSA